MASLKIWMITKYLTFTTLLMAEILEQISERDHSLNTPFFIFANLRSSNLDCFRITCAKVLNFGIYMLGDLDFLNFEALFLNDKIDKMKV